MADGKIDMALDDIIKSNRGGRGNRRGGRGGGLQRQQRGGNNQRGNSRGRIGKSNNNRGGGGRNSFNQRNLNRSNNYQQQRGGRNSFAGYTRRNNNAGDKPTATYNPLNRDADASTSKQSQQQQQQQTAKNVSTPRRQQGSVFNKIRQTPNAPTGNVTALRRRMVAAQRALNRATKTLAAIPRIRQQRQRILQQPQKLRNIITRNRVSGGAIRKRLGTGPRNVAGRGGARGRGRRAFV